MGFQIRWDKLDIERQIHRMASEIHSPYNDGFTAWSIKKDLLDIKFLVDNILEKSQTFVDEADYIEAQRKKQTWSILNDKKSNN